MAIERISMSDGSRQSPEAGGGTAVAEPPAQASNQGANTGERRGPLAWFRRGSTAPQPPAEDPTEGSSGGDSYDDVRAFIDGRGDNGDGNDGGSGGGGGGGRPDEPERPRPPEGFPRFTIEQLRSPEYRAERWRVVKKLMSLEGLTNEELYGNPEKRQQISDFYKQWKYLESLDNRKAVEPPPFDPSELEEEQEDLAQRQREVYDRQDLARIPNIDGTPITKDKFPTPKQWRDEYKRLLRTSIPEGATEAVERETNINTAREYLSRYFKEAHTAGPLDAIDRSFDSIVKEIYHSRELGLSPDEILQGRPESQLRRSEAVQGVNKRIEGLRDLTKRIVEQSNSIRGIADLEELLDVYINYGLEKLMPLVHESIPPPIPIEGGFRFEEELGEGFTRLLEEEGETYWRPTYSNFFEVYARNATQFEIAKKTFIRWVRTGIGKSPNEVFGKVNGFKEALTSAGQRAGREMQTHTNNDRLELEGIVGMIEANLFDELHDMESFQASWKFIVATPEAVARMLAFIKTSDGIMAAALHVLTTDPELELLHSPHGSRGQLDGANADRNAIEMRSMQEQIIPILTARVLGMSLKRYHPDDPEKRIDKKGRLYKRNLGEITRYKSDEYFKNLYEGFDIEDQEELYKELTEKQVQVDQINALKEAIRQGVVDEAQQDRLKQMFGDNFMNQSVDLIPAEKAALERLTRARKIQQHFEEGHTAEELRGKERDMWEEANNAVELAWEAFGAMAEKAQRGGTVYLVDRIQEGKKFRDFIPDYWARKFCHMAEKWNKATYGGDMDRQTQDRLRAAGWRNVHSTGLNADELFYKVGQARRFAIWQLKAFGRDAKLWDFTLLRDGKPVDINTLGYTIYGINQGAKNDVDKYRYAAPENERIIGYNTAGEEIVLVFDDEGRPKMLERVDGVSTGVIKDLEYDQQGRAVIYNKSNKDTKWVEEEHKEIPVNVPLSDRTRLLFDNLKESTRAQPLKLKVPRGITDPETGKLKFDSSSGKLIIAPGGPDLVHVNYDSIVHRFYAHPYVVPELSPYPGYQEEWTGLLLHPDTLAEARDIKAGRIRYEDAMPHALHLLMVDPTLQRVGHFDVVSLEPVAVLASQDESYQSEWLIGDELFLNFFGEDASRPKNRTEFVLQDHGGGAKGIIHNRAEAALWLDARARRLRTFLPFAANDWGSLPKMASAPRGPLDVFRMMAYEKYKLIGQFFQDKWVNTIIAAKDLNEATTISTFNPQEKKIEEALERKLNNEADTNLKPFYEMLEKITKTGEHIKENDYQRFLVGARESQGRPRKYMHRNTVLQSLFRGERAPLNLVGLEVYARNRENGRFILDSEGHRMLNPDIDTNVDSGSSRHRNGLFWYRWARFVRSRAYSRLYRDTVSYYAQLDKPLTDAERLREEAHLIGSLPAGSNGWDWLRGKDDN